MNYLLFGQNAFLMTMQIVGCSQKPPDYMARHFRVSIENLGEELKVQNAVASAAVADREQLQTEAGQLR